MRWERGGVESRGMAGPHSGFASKRQQVEMLMSSDSEPLKIRGVKAKAFCQPRLKSLITASQMELLQRHS